MGTILKRIAAAVTAVAVTVTAGLFTASAETITYEVSTDLDNITNIMENYCFIALDELDVSGHQHGSAITKKITKNPKPAGGTDIMSELCLRDAYGPSITYIEEFENLNGIVKIGYNKDALRVGENYTIRKNANEKFIVCSDAENCEHKVESAGTVIADTATEKYMDIDNLKSSFISYNKQLAKTAASGTVTQSGQTYTVNAMSGAVYYNIDSSNYYNINADSVIDFPAGSTAILVLNIDMNGITWDRKPFVLKEGGSSVTFNEDVFWHKTANRIYYNFYDSSKTDLQYTGTINMAAVGWGTVIAPSASLTYTTNFCGVLVASNITVSGETHFVGAYNPVTPVDEGDTPVAPELKAEIKFNKIDSEKKIALVGATFGIYSTSDCSGTPITSSSSDSSGVVHFKDISAGTYYLKEIQAPSGYNKNETIYSVLVQFDASGNGIVTFDGGKTELTIPNDPIKAVVTTTTTKATTTTTKAPTTTTKATTTTTKAPATTTKVPTTTTKAPTTTTKVPATTTKTSTTTSKATTTNKVTTTTKATTKVTTKAPTTTTKAPTTTTKATTTNKVTTTTANSATTTAPNGTTTTKVSNGAVTTTATVSNGAVTTTAPNGATTTTTSNGAATTTAPNGATTTTTSNGAATTTAPNGTTTTTTSNGAVTTTSSNINDSDETAATDVTYNPINTTAGSASTTYPSSRPNITTTTTYRNGNSAETGAKDTSINMTMTAKDTTASESTTKVTKTDEGSTEKTTKTSKTDKNGDVVTTKSTTSPKNDDVSETTITTKTDTTKPPVEDSNDYDYDVDYDEDDDDDDDEHRSESDSDGSGSVQTTDGSETLIVETSNGGMTAIETSTGIETSTVITSGSGDNPYTGVENAAGFAIVFGELALAAAIVKKKK